jgi:DNA modification methylase
VFPVGLPDFFIRAFSDVHDVVLDPFLGSGTTLIAAEQTERRCCGLEISPAYCDVIVKRWEAFTGQTAVRESAQAVAD